MSGLTEVTLTEHEFTVLPQKEGEGKTVRLFDKDPMGGIRKITDIPLNEQAVGVLHELLGKSNAELISEMERREAEAAASAEAEFTEPPQSGDG